MKKVIIVFPDATSMADFIITNKVGNAEVNSIEKTLVALLTDSQIAIARTKYKAILRTLIGVYSCNSRNSY